MSPLLFANWRAINARFCALMWVIAIGLVAFIIVRFTAGSAPMPLPHSIATTRVAGHLAATVATQR